MTPLIRLCADTLVGRLAVSTILPKTNNNCTNTPIEELNASIILLRTR